MARLSCLPFCIYVQRETSHGLYLGSLLSVSVILLLVASASGQAIPMATGRSVQSSAAAPPIQLEGRTRLAAARANPDKPDKCPDSGKPWGYSYLVPLNRNVKGGVHLLVDSDGKPIEVPSNLAVECFFGATSYLQPLAQVQYLYGLGSSPSSVSMDLASLHFPLGFQLAFGSSLTGKSSAGSASTMPGQATPAEAVQQLQAGGDFYLRSTYPVFYRNVGSTTTLIVFNPKVGFNFSGFGSQGTISEATEYNWNESFEGYAEYRAFSLSSKPGGAIYIDARGGLQGVQGAFARSIGLGNKTEFPMAQVAFGVLFNGFIRVGVQKFFGPSQLYTTTAGAPPTSQSDFRKWHLVLQLAPHL
jgi:hypothetical protein